MGILLNVNASSRLNGLGTAAAQQLVAAAQLLDLGRADEARARLQPVLESNPTHPEALRLCAGILTAKGDYQNALLAIRHALRQRPDDALYHNTLGTLLGASGDVDGAVAAFRHACEIDPHLATGWFNLGVMLTRSVRHEEALAALQKCVNLAPSNMPARALLADLLRTRGKVAQAAEEYRRILATSPWSGDAWWGLADLRTQPLGPADIQQMQAALQSTQASDGDRIAIGFALGQALDGQRRYAESLAALERANAIARNHQHWDAKSFSASMDAIIRAFAHTTTTATNAELGSNVIFIVGMPRSGTTLVEQILASHPQVEGSGELPDMPATLTEASRHFGQAFPDWVAALPADAWQRIGKRYLARTMRWRTRHPRFTDKLPGNWMYIGAIRAALPAARIVICRRDPLETCFSCYRQRLAGNEYTRTFADLAAYWRAFDRAAAYWAGRDPKHVYQHAYEDLLANPDATIRRLLEFCGLPPDDACFRFHESRREVRSPSATQVRQALRKDTARSAHYGKLLDPLRAALAEVQHRS